MENNNKSNSEIQQNEETNLSIFTEENIEKIKHINNLLKKEEERIRPYAQKLRAALRKNVSDKEIWDYNFRTELAAFSSVVACNKRHNTTEGNPIYRERICLYGNKYYGETDEIFYSNNWNLYCPTGHPLHNIPFCYSMFCIAFQSDLTWQDILDINYVWLDLKVDYQFLIAYDETLLAEFEKQSIPANIVDLKNIDCDKMSFEQRQVWETNPNIFDTKNIEKLRHLNELLKKEEQRIQPFSQKLQALLNETLALKEVDDFNYSPRYICHSITTDYIRRNKDMRDSVDSNWPYKGYLSLFSEVREDKECDYKYSHNWNYQKGGTHPLADIPFCYTMKVLYYESGLNLQDILDIDNIRFSLEVDYQFFICYDKNLNGDEIKIDS